MQLKSPAVTNRSANRSTPTFIPSLENEGKQNSKRSEFGGINQLLFDADDNLPGHL
jgi:hypothetical protein